MHDPRIGRFFAVEPLSDKFPHNSPYAFSENRVIDAIELEGIENIRVHELQKDGTQKYIETVRNDWLIGEINQYNYKINGLTTKVAFRMKTLESNIQMSKQLMKKTMQFNLMHSCQKKKKRKIIFHLVLT